MLLNPVYDVMYTNTLVEVDDSCVTRVEMLSYVGLDVFSDYETKILFRSPSGSMNSLYTADTKGARKLCSILRLHRERQERQS